MSVWTRHLVADRLIEAARVIAATVRGDLSDGGGGGHCRDIPAGVNYFGEDQVMEFERRRHAHFVQEGYFDEKGMQIRPLPWIWPLERAQPAQAIDRAAEALRWPVLHVPDDRRRVAVLSWMAHRAARGRGHGFTETVNARLKRLFLERVEKSTAHRLKDQGLIDIAFALNAAEAEARETGAMAA